MRVNSSNELEVYEEVGRGGFGVVYRGIIKSTLQEVAIKQIDLEQDATDLIEINKEIQIISECRCPQITSYYGSFVKNYKLWVVMEYVDGGSIFDLLKAGPIDDGEESAIAVIAKEVLLALVYLHDQGKIHRDLKSQNIMLNKLGNVKLTDFGVSAQLGSNFSKRNTTVGTPYWMAPEVILNSKGGHSFKADVWSLGCCCYEMYTGKPPLQRYHAPMKALRLISRCEQNGDFIKMIALDELRISDEFRSFLNCCFIEDPATRFSARKLLNHPFVNRKILNSQRLMKKLITKKQLWNQQHQNIQRQNFYVPTQMYDNQRQWSDGEMGAIEGNVLGNDGVKFDISMIEEEEEKEEKEEKKQQKNHETQQGTTRSRASTSPTIPTPTTTPNRLLTPKKGSVSSRYQETFERDILNKSYQKLILRQYFTSQEHFLVKQLNQNMGALVIENKNKILLFQYLRIMIKELAKDKNGVLGSMILPSSLRNHYTRGRSLSNTSATINAETNGTGAKNSLGKQSLNAWPSKFDEIEQSLMDSWIKRMKEAHQ